MANKPQLKAVGEQGFGESDPFAELTRIMGFDPRIQPTPRPEDDFQIDLEKELMGEFGEADPHRHDALQQAEPSLADLHRQASDEADARLEQPAVVPQPTEDLEDALTSAFQQELGEESDVPALADDTSGGGTGEEEAFLPRVDEVVVSESDTPSSVVYSAETGSREPSVVESVVEGAVEDRGAEFAESLKNMLSDAGYRSGSSFSGPAQVYEIRTSYTTPAPAGEDAARFRANEGEADLPEASVSEASLDMSASPEPRSTVFGTTAPEWADNSEVPSVPAAFEPASEERVTDDRIEPEQAASPEPLSRGENIEEPGDPFAVLAALGSEPSANAFGLPHGSAPAAGPSAVLPLNMPRRLEGAARFYSSLDLFSRATPVVPGMRQQQRVSSPVAPVEARPPEIPAEAAFAAAEELAPVVPAGVSEDEPIVDEMVGDQENIPVDAFEMEMRDAIAAFAEADTERPGLPAEVPPQASADDDHASDGGPVIASAPEIETVDVPDPAVAIADDLDIPAPPMEEAPPPAPAFDDLDNEFVAAFSDMRPKGQAAVPTASDQDAELTARIEELFSAEEFDLSEQAPVTAMAASASVAAAASSEGRHEQEAYAFGNDYYDAQPAYADIPEEPAAYPPSRLIAVRDRRGPLVAAVIGCVVIAGAAGAFAYSHYSAKESGPVLLKADARPVKMKPKHPGGITVPNQDNQVYRRVADGDVPAPVEQQKLVTSVEKPVDLSTSAKSAAPSGASASALPGVEMPNIPKASSQEIAALAKAAADQPQKNQDRVPASHAVGADTSRVDDVIAVEPRKVRTMIVKPDGTMVPTPMPAATEAAAPKSVASAALEEPAAKVLPGVKSEAAAEHLQKPAPQAGNDAVVTPRHVEVAPSRPAEQPVTIKEPARDEKVASVKVEPAHPATAAASGWAMQIASQPSAAAAQTNYQRLAHRYGSVLGGHGVDIVKAEIAGKGTYYRVRVPASSREEAIALCTKYKAAGGNCFVSR
jgi:hypothetical protein